MGNFRQVLVEQHGDAGLVLAKELEHKSSRIYKSVIMLINSVSADSY
jgi:hypothetical protein